VTLKQALTQAQERLAGHKDIENPTLESEVLLRYVLQIDRVQLRLELNQELSLEQEERFWKLVQRRLQDEPLAYIIRRREFFGLDIFVDRRVLIPRPETEHLVEEALKFAREHPGAIIADIGTGSGAIAISLAVNLLPSSSCLVPSPPKIYATDISPEALEVALINCRKYNVEDRIILLHGDLLEPLLEPADIIIANLPYVKNTDVSEMPSAQFEPVSALKGGEQGLDEIFRLAKQLKGKLRPGGCLLMEIGQGQSQAAVDCLKDLFPSGGIEIIPDLAGIERVVKLIN
jgi:release factor glutamine methyltransferase